MDEFISLYEPVFVLETDQVDFEDDQTDVVKRSQRSINLADLLKPERRFTASEVVLSPVIIESVTNDSSNRSSEQTV